MSSLLALCVRGIPFAACPFRQLLASQALLLDRRFEAQAPVLLLTTQATCVAARSSASLGLSVSPVRQVNENKLLMEFICALTAKAHTPPLRRPPVHGKHNK